MSKDNGNAVAVREPSVQSGALAGLSEEKRELLKRTIAKGATDDELELALTMAGTWGLDPFAKQIAFIKRWDSREKREVMSIQPTIDGARLLAQRSQNYGGQLGPWWCDTDGHWVEVWLKDTPPAAAKVGVINKDWEQPLYAVAKFSSYCAKKDGKPIALWATMPELMIAKCAEMLALRRAFPAEFREFYGSGDEAAVADSISYTNVVEAEGVVADKDTGEIVASDEQQTQPTRADAMRRLHKLAADRGISHVQLRDMAIMFYGVKASLTEMSDDDLSAFAGAIEQSTDEQIRGTLEALHEPVPDAAADNAGAPTEAQADVVDDPASPVPGYLERIANATKSELKAITEELVDDGISDPRLGDALTSRHNALRGVKQPELVTAPAGDPGDDRFSR